MTDTPRAVALATRYLDTYNAADFARLRELLAPNIVFRLDHSVMEFSHRDDMVNMFAAVKEEIPNRRFEAGDIKVATDEQIVIDHVWTGTAAVDVPRMQLAAGDTVRHPVITIMTFRDGLMTRFEDYNYPGRH